MFGTALLFVSVVTGVVARRYARRLSEETIQQAERDKRAHDQAIAQLEKDTAEANARAAEANKVAEQERLARKKIEEHLKPRVPTQQQANEITVRLKPFAGQQVEVSWYPGDTEAGLFESVLEGVLVNMCGWKVSRVPLPSEQLGTWIAYDSAVPEAERPGKALFAALADVLGMAMGGPYPSIMGSMMDRPISNGKVLLVIGTLYGSKSQYDWQTSK